MWWECIPGAAIMLATIPAAPICIKGLNYLFYGRSHKPEFWLNDVSTAVNLRDLNLYGKHCKLKGLETLDESS